MAQRITIDLIKNKAVADVVADLSPGETVYARASIVSKDAQSLVVELEEVSDSCDGLDSDASDDTEAESGDEMKSEGDLSTHDEDGAPTPTT